MVGVPTVWGYSGSGVETHHNSEDTPDRVDPRSLRDIAIIDAAVPLLPSPTRARPKHCGSRGSARAGVMNRS